jgi:hypothetical protein
MDASNSILNGDRAAELLGTTERRVRSWVAKGTLPGRVLPDGSVVVTYAALTEWVESGRGLAARPDRKAVNT